MTDATMTATFRLYPKIGSPESIARHQERLRQQETRQKVSNDRN